MKRCNTFILILCSLGILSAEDFKKDNEIKLEQDVISNNQYETLFYMKTGGAVLKFYPFPFVSSGAGGRFRFGHNALDVCVSAHVFPFETKRNYQSVSLKYIFYPFTNAGSRFYAGFGPSFGEFQWDSDLLESQRNEFSLTGDVTVGLETDSFFGLRTLWQVDLIDMMNPDGFQDGYNRGVALSFGLGF